MPLDGKVPDVLVGYVEGSGDTVANDLKHVGVRVELLDDEALRGADLSHARLSDAVLKAADLRGADLDGVALHGLRLDGTKLDMAQAVQFATAYGARVSG